MRHFKPSRNLRKLLISSPITSPINSPATSNCSIFSSSEYSVILKVNFDFVGESYPELSVNEGEYVKFVERLDNGWLMVQCIDKAERGIIPALYVNVEVSDPDNSISNNWLRGLKNNVISRDFPQRAKISQVLLNQSGHFWYLYEVSMNSGKIIFFGKLYQDFYTLHCALEKSIGERFNLPPLPKPITICKGEEKKFKLGRILKRCKELNDYQRSILDISEICHNPVMLDFISADNGQLIVFERKEAVPSIEILTEMIYRNSNNFHFFNLASQRSFSTTAPLPRDDNDSLILDTMRACSQHPYSNHTILDAHNSTHYSLPINYKGDYYEQSHSEMKRQEVLSSRSSHALSSFSSLIDSYDDAADGSDSLVAAK